MDLKADIGTAILRESAKTIVRFVDPSTPSDRAGILVGDEIVAVDGTSIADKPTAEIRWLMRKAYYWKGKCSVSLLRNGEQQTIVISKHDPVKLTAKPCAQSSSTSGHIRTDVQRALTCTAKRRCCSSRTQREPKLWFRCK
jgi:C-terminal processing protease CtpA/Prc